ncbi:hypothetical protein OJAV_G00072730 [Oryzias javanicus]|uniref:Uncharacterized protein n=1 Tax=Oryzias javanicus TaxID=123683 RepID=A0A437D8X0_ORYJA|nr:hypothetical protein OJAV_G00072730 [Oryzias javanicus]
MQLNRVLGAGRRFKYRERKRSVFLVTSPETQNSCSPQPSFFLCLLPETLRSSQLQNIPVDPARTAARRQELPRRPEKFDTKILLLSSRFSADLLTFRSTWSCRSFPMGTTMMLRGLWREDFFQKKKSSCSTKMKIQRDLSSQTLKGKPLLECRFLT